MTFSIAKDVLKRLIAFCESGHDRAALVRIHRRHYVVAVDATLEQTLARRACELIGVYTPDCPLPWLLDDLVAA